MAEPRLAIFEDLAAETLLPGWLPTPPDPPTVQLRAGGAHRWRTPPPTEEAPVAHQPEHVHSPHPERKLGRLPEDPDRPRLHLKTFLRGDYKGEVPELVDYSPRVPQWPMYLNDRLGSCTAADAGHAVQLWTAWGQDYPVLPSDDDILAFYSGSSGYVPGKPDTDRGATMQEVNEYFRRTGLSGRTIEAFFRVDTDDLDEIRTALFLFGSVSVGMAFPAYAMAQHEAGQPWHVPNPLPRDSRIMGGHDVLVVGARKGGNLLCVTWGRLQEITPKFWARYMGSRAHGEAWTRVETDWANKTGVAPGNALNTGQLNDAFMALTGEPGPFQHPPAPPPLPPTRAELIRGVAADLDGAAAKLRLLAGDYE